MFLNITGSISIQHGRCPIVLPWVIDAMIESELANYLQTFGWQKCFWIVYDCRYYFRAEIYTR